MIPLPPPGAPPLRLPPAEQLLRELRKELLNSLHLGRLRPGDRLQSIRAVARERGVDHRLVAQAYHALAAEGLVVVRGRSGIFVTGRPSASPPVAPPNEHADWLAEVLAGAWGRGLYTTGLLELVDKCADLTSFRCACVESNVDQMVAYCAEIEGATGIAPLAVYLAPTDRGALAEPDRVRLAAQLRNMDLVVTTPYHMVAVHDAAAAYGVPVVILNLNPELVESVRARIRGGSLTVVAASEEFGARMRLMYADVIEHPSQMRVLLASTPGLSAKLHPAEPVLLTRAARALLPDGIRAPRLAFPHSPTMAQETLREIADSVVRARLRALQPPALAPAAAPHTDFPRPASAPRRQGAALIRTPPAAAR